MKYCLSIFFLVSNFLFDQDYEEKFSSDICGCFDKNEVETRIKFDETIFEKCFSKVLEKNQNELVDYLIKDIDTTDLVENAYDYGYELGYKEGQRILGSIQKHLIDNCDSYYEFSSQLISYMTETLKKDVEYKTLDSLSDLIEKKPEDVNLIWERGAYKMALEEYNNAQLDFALSLEKDPNHLPSLFFLA